MSVIYYHIRRKRLKMIEEMKNKQELNDDNGNKLSQKNNDLIEKQNEK